MNDQSGMFLSVHDFEVSSAAGYPARIADLSAGLAIERRTIQHDVDQRISVLHRLDGNSVNDDPDNLCFGVGGIVSEEFGVAMLLADGVERPSGHHTPTARAALLPVFLFRNPVTFHVDRQAAIFR